MYYDAVSNILRSTSEGIHHALGLTSEITKVAVVAPPRIEVIFLSTDKQSNSSLDVL